MAIGIIITFVGIGEKGFKTIQLRWVSQLSESSAGWSIWNEILINRISFVQLIWCWLRKCNFPIKIAFKWETLHRFFFTKLTEQPVMNWSIFMWVFPIFAVIKFSLKLLSFRYLLWRLFSSLSFHVVRLIGPVLVLVGLVMVAVRVMMCTLPTCYSVGDWGSHPRRPRKQRQNFSHFQTKPVHRYPKYPLV